MTASDNANNKEMDKLTTSVVASINEMDKLSTSLAQTTIKEQSVKKNQTPFQDMYLVHKQNPNERYLLQPTDFTMEICSLTKKSQKRTPSYTWTWGQKNNQWKYSYGEKKERVVIEPSITKVKSAMRNTRCPEFYERYSFHVPSHDITANTFADYQLEMTMPFRLQDAVPTAAYSSIVQNTKLEYIDDDPDGVPVLSLLLDYDSRVNY